MAHQRQRGEDNDADLCQPIRVDAAQSHNGVSVPAANNWNLPPGSSKGHCGAYRTNGSEETQILERIMEEDR